MKKVIAILSIVALVSCGGGNSSEVVVDSTSVDSALVSDTAVVLDSVQLGGSQPTNLEMK
jgi:hypothetical protein